MKKVIGLLGLIIIGVSVYYLVPANPIAVIIYLNELAFTPNGWVLEIESNVSVNTHGWYLTSRQDTAYLKTMTIVGNTPRKITQDSLLTQLRVDSSGDGLKLYSSYASPCNLVFGSSPSADIVAPKSGQSICSMSGQYYYLDNTPTLGFQNDTINATGQIAGWVKNSGLPLRGVKVTGFGSGDTTTTDSAGYFIISSIARCQSLVFSANNYLSQSIKQQVWPESTVTMNVNMVVSVEKIKAETMPKNFVISEPFPNPFNPETRIRYTLPQKGDVKIEVFDMSGKLVDRIFSGFQLAGSYQARWNAINFPSGVYVIQVHSGYASLSKKCVLVK